MADVVLLAATVGEGPMLARLGELYAYDFSEITGADIGDDGFYAGDFFAPRLSEAARTPYVIRVGGRVAGFAVAVLGSRLTGDPKTADVAEFFVLRRHRRRGVGCAAARALFDTHRGWWDVRQMSENAAARAFWRSTIARYTSGRFEEVHHDDARWRGWVQRFRND